MKRVVVLRSIKIKLQFRCGEKGVQIIEIELSYGLWFFSTVVREEGFTSKEVMTKVLKQSCSLCAEKKYVV